MEWGQNQLSLQDQMLAFYNSANHRYIEFMRLYIISMFLQYKSYHFHMCVTTGQDGLPLTKRFFVPKPNRTISTVLS